MAGPPQARKGTLVDPSDQEGATLRGQLTAGQRTAAAAALLTVLLASGKGWIGHLRGSPALTADAVHSAADALAVFASWVGLQLAGRAPTRRFPFGLYRAETLATLVAATLILLAGAELLTTSAGTLAGGPQGLHHSIDVLVAALVSAGASMGIYLAERRAGQRLGSASLLANADETRVDIGTSLAVFGGGAASYAGVRYVEATVTAVLAALVLWLGLKHGRVALMGLLDASMDPALESRVAAVARGVPGVRGVAELRLRQAGLFWFGVARIQISRSLDIARGHEIAHAVVQAVRQALPRVESLTVHLEPFVPLEFTVLVPVQRDTEDTLLSEHFGRAPFFALATLTAGRVTRLDLIGNPARTHRARAGLAAVKLILRGQGVDVVLTREMGEISYHALRDHYA
jgi:cation diffusion facilitator family transporter